MSSKMISFLSTCWKSDYVTLAKFLVPLAFTDVVVDIGEQFLYRSISSSVEVVDNIAAFGLAYVLIKFFVGVVEEVKQVGVVLVQDRPGFHKILVCILVMAFFIFIFSIVISQTKLGLWFFKDFHGISWPVYHLTNQALLQLSAFPAIHAVSWYHGGVLLQYRYSGIVGMASLMDIITQILVLAVVLWTRLICHSPLAVPIIAAYAGILVRCGITLTAFYVKVYPQLSKEKTHPVSVWRLVVFVSPLMFVLAIQRSTRPMLNLLVAHYAPSKTAADRSVAVLSVTYPLGHICYGWLNQLRPVPPTFRKENRDKNRAAIGWKKVAIFHTSALVLSVVLSVSLLWLPGVSVFILVQVIGVPHQLALLCINPLRVFSFFCFTVCVRASLTGWLTLHRQTKLVSPSGVLRLVTVLGTFFTLQHLGLSGGLLGLLALFSGFFAEMVAMATIAPIYACWMRYKWRCWSRQEQEDLTELVALEDTQEENGQNLLEKDLDNEESERDSKVGEPVLESSL